ncbi:hypothetical protein BDW74DRAFT_179093 [Aspergillus multicolor]|uniref:uncharacterized protein n=1 Tax=Aspergillus multicolor TaxID=41759 RepID=UPI003CCDF019
MPMKPTTARATRSKSSNHKHVVPKLRLTIPSGDFSDVQLETKPNTPDTASSMSAQQNQLPDLTRALVLRPKHSLCEANLAADRNAGDHGMFTLVLRPKRVSEAKPTAKFDTPATAASASTQQNHLASLPRVNYSMNLPGLKRTAELNFPKTTALITTKLKRISKLPCFLAGGDFSPVTPKQGPTTIITACGTIAPFSPGLTRGPELTLIIPTPASSRIEFMSGLKTAADLLDELEFNRLVEEEIGDLIDEILELADAHDAAVNKKLRNSKKAQAKEAKAAKAALKAEYAEQARKTRDAREAEATVDQTTHGP